MQLADFRLSPLDLEFVGTDLARPESVLVHGDGTIFVSDARGGVTALFPDGTERTIGDIDGLPNGLAFAPDGSILVSDLEGGRLLSLGRSGSSRVLLDELDGAPLGPVIFASCDTASRIWIAAPTQTVPRRNAAYTPTADGRILVIDAGVARTAATGLYFPNEVRVAPDARHLFATETSRGRIVRLAIGTGSQLGQPEVYGPGGLFSGALVDGFAFDAEGNVWVTEITRNGIHVIQPGGRHHCIFEDPDGSILPFPSSIAFGGTDGRTVYVGSTKTRSIATFRSPVAGLPIPHASHGATSPS